MTAPTGPDQDALDPEVERALRALRRARGLRVAARRALALARRYRAEDGPRGAREGASVAQALAWRAAARELRGSARAVGPGLARGSLAPSSSARRAG